MLILSSARPFVECFPIALSLLDSSLERVSREDFQPFAWKERCVCQCSGKRSAKRELQVSELSAQYAYIHLIPYFENIMNISSQHTDHQFPLSSLLLQMGKRHVSSSVNRRENSYAKTASSAAFHQSSRYPLPYLLTPNSIHPAFS